MEDQVSKVLQSFDSRFCSLILIGQEGGWGGGNIASFRTIFVNLIKVIHTNNKPPELQLPLIITVAGCSCCTNLALIYPGTSFTASFRAG